MNESNHPQENPVSRLAIGLFKELASAALPGSGTLVDLLQEFKRKKIASAQQILLEDLRGTTRELNEIEKDEFIPMAYMFFKAADEGLANRNIRLLSKLVRDEIDSESIAYDRYASAAHVAKLLTTEEIAALSTLFKRLPGRKSFGNDGIAGFDRLHFETLEKDICKDFPNLFPTEDVAVFALSSLSGKGVLVPIITMAFGENLPTYFPTELAIRLAKHADDAL